MRRFPAWIRENPVLPWAVLFILLELSVTQYGGTNARSRWAAMRAITEGHTLAIDNYTDWTVDWSQAPDGRYYSNKAPGAAFLALPVFALTELVSLPMNRHRLDEKGRAPAPGYVPHLIVTLATQILPFALLVLWIARHIPGPAAHFFALASFLGNTAALYMNSHFGHGLAALLFLGAAWAWWRKRYAMAGVCLSWCLLTDYGAAFTLPFFLAATLWRERSILPLVRIGVGALPGAVVWIWYHTAAFGSPFLTANQFINPEQLEPAPGTNALWSPIPSGEVLWKLLFGPERGLLFTQPWALAVFALPLLRRPTGARGLALLFVGSLAGLLWMNAGFGGWHGGWCIGPRYISLVFPALAFALALHWESFPGWSRRALWMGLAVALLFRLITYPFSSLAPNENLWYFHLWLILQVRSGTIFLRLAMVLLYGALAVWWWRKRAHRTIPSAIPVNL